MTLAEHLALSTSEGGSHPSNTWPDRLAVASITEYTHPLDLWDMARIPIEVTRYITAVSNDQVREAITQARNVSAHVGFAFEPPRGNAGSSGPRNVLAIIEPRREYVSDAQAAADGIVRNGHRYAMRRGALVFVLGHAHTFTETKIGNCYYEHKCPCGAMYRVDSSD